MIKTVASVSLPVLEKLEIKKNRIESGKGNRKSHREKIAFVFLRKIIPFD